MGDLLDASKDLDKSKDLDTVSVDFVKAFLLPRIDQLEAEVKMLREITWPVCQALYENGDPLSCIEQKRRYFSVLFKDEAIDLLEKKSKFTGIGNNVIMNQELDMICTVKSIDS